MLGFMITDMHTEIPLLKVQDYSCGTHASLFRAKRGLYSGSRVVSYGFWAYLSCASKISFSPSSVTRAMSPCVAESKAVAALKMVMQGLQTLRFG